MEGDPFHDRLDRKVTTLFVIVERDTGKILPGIYVDNLQAAVIADELGKGKDRYVMRPAIEVEPRKLCG